MENPYQLDITISKNLKREINTNSKKTVENIKHSKKIRPNLKRKISEIS